MPWKNRAAGISSRLDARVATIEQTTIEQTTIEQTTIVEDRGISPALFYAGVGLTAATALTGAVFGIRALTIRSDQRAVNPLATDERLRLRSRAQDSARIADVFFISAGVLAVGTTVVFFLTDFGGDDAVDPPDAPHDAKAKKNASKNGSASGSKQRSRKS